MPNVAKRAARYLLHMWLARPPGTHACPRAAMQPTRGTAFMRDPISRDAGRGEGGAQCLPTPPSIRRGDTKESYEGMELGLAVGFCCYRRRRTEAPGSRAGVRMNHRVPTTRLGTPGRPQISGAEAGDSAGRTAPPGGRPRQRAARPRRRQPSALRAKRSSRARHSGDTLSCLVLPAAALFLGPGCHR
ncbi:hypothetical protein Purlil1_1011 [Purpureocillium lilacinum]|uniref:Uncharacterized protein n=1 Tax=Purpureocillium lilacinum TaxID=33203 RepID=A0ABR0CDA3_PURLI|nr:hypothetical protein Purlil1_1011 [Purpureocillium lilacinum]